MESDTDGLEPAAKRQKTAVDLWYDQGKIYTIRPADIGPRKKWARPTGSALKIYKYPEAPPASDASLQVSAISTKDPDRELIFSLKDEIGCPNLDSPYKDRVAPRTLRSDHGKASQDEEPEEDEKYHTHLDGTKPPLSDLDAIFDNIAGKLGRHSFKKAVRALGGRRLSFFTMCSGTEAPAMAMQKLKAAFERQGFYEFDISHAASAEIEPFKQAYIQTNFAPPLIFRDVTDFSKTDDSKPITVYGAPADPPDNIDILIAGSSCVDYSNLNVTPKDFQIDGESWATMKGITEYVKKHHPVMAIIENVKLAPWKDISAYWDSLHYISHVVKVDSKNFYFPQTRERGYMLAIDRELALARGFDYLKAFATFEKILTDLAHRATSPYTAFAYFPDDPMFEVVTQDMMDPQSGRKGNSRWDACYVRHNKHRTEHELGFGRQLTLWENNGSSCPPDYFAMRAMMQRKPERILDTLDIFKARYLVQRLYDVYFKSRAVDLSQNVDRELDSRHFGIVPCITPDGQIFDTLRGGVFSGKELLTLQGIPVEELTFTTETSKRLTDFAGNAMTTSVVGAIIAAVLSVSNCMLDTSEFDSLFPRREGVNQKQPRQQQPGHRQVVTDWEATNLRHQKLSLDGKQPRSLQEINKVAAQSRQMCLCEGYSGLRPGPFFICKDCGHTVCASCKGNPAHNLEELPREERRQPSEFVSFMQLCLPRTLTLNGAKSLAVFESFAPFDVRKQNAAYHTAARDAARGIYQYSTIKRSRKWKVEYVSPDGRLELHIIPTSAVSDSLSDGVVGNQIMECQWQLYASCPENTAAGDDLRIRLQSPIARMKPGSDILHGKWEAWNPRPEPMHLNVTSAQQLQPSHESNLKIQHARWRHRKEFAKLEITIVGTKHTESIPFDLLSSCAAPHGSIYQSQKPFRGDFVYLMLDSAPFSPAEEDSYVITTDPHRRNNHEHRPVIFRSRPGWRINIVDGDLDEKETVCTFVDGWEDLPSMSMSFGDRYADVWLSPSSPATSQDLVYCKGTLRPSLGVEVPLPRNLARTFPTGTDIKINLAGQSGRLRPFEWLLTQIEIPYFQRWQALGFRTVGEGECDCCPHSPELTWCWVWENGKCAKKIIKPFEDQGKAGNFETKLKARPSPAEAVIHCYEGMMLVEVSLNPQTLAHRAAAAVRPLAKDGIASTEWRLVRYDPLEPLPPFAGPALKSNAEDRLWPYDEAKEGAELRLPANFHRMLWKEQRQLLGWALHLEMNGTGWQEMEQTDLAIPPLRLSLEAQAKVKSDVRGGVIADEVGAGKTTSALALVAADMENLQSWEKIQVDETTNKILSHATLILVPAKLVGQWVDQIKDCFRDTTDLIIELHTVDDIIRCELGELVGKKIIVTSWELFDDVKYWECLRVLSYSPNVPFSGGRAFEQWIRLALGNLGGMFAEYDQTDESKFWTQRMAGKKHLQQFHHFPAYRNRKATNATYTANEAPEALPDEMMELSLKFKPDPEKVLGDSRLDIAWEQEMEIWPGLSDPAAKKIYALFHAFQFRRLIVDEFQYLRGLSLQGVISLSAINRWLVSATPPTNTPAGINTMARLLGTHISHEDVRPDYLGVDGKSCPEVHTHSHVEEFLRYLKAPSNSGIRAQHGQAKQFVDFFVRQNPLTLPDVELRSNCVVFRPSAPDYATYLEFFQAVLSTSISYQKKGKPNVSSDARSDCVKRWAAHSFNALHALVCSTSYMRKRNGGALTDPKATFECKDILKEERHEFAKLGKEILQHCKEAFWYDRKCSGGSGKQNVHWAKFIDSIAGGDFEDPVVVLFVNHLLAAAEKDPSKPDDLAINIRERRLRKKPKGRPENHIYEEEKEWHKAEDEELGYRNKLLTGLVLRLIKAARVVRFFDAVSNAASLSKDVKCTGCGEGGRKKLNDLALLANCGHIVCGSCLKTHKEAGNDTCPSNSCKVLVNGRLQVPASTFAYETVAHTKHGSRMDTVVQQIQEVLANSKTDQILILVQFDQMKTHLLEALSAAKIQKTDSTATATFTFGDKVQGFIDDPKKRVLILKTDSPDAAGWNLQMINHVMFVAPFLAGSKHAYKSIMKQAIGRALRFGQKHKIVDVYFFAMASTCEVNILEEFQLGKAIVIRNGQVEQVDKVEEGDKLLRGPSLDVHEIAGASDEEVAAAEAGEEENVEEAA